MRFWKRRSITTSTGWSPRCEKGGLGPQVQSWLGNGGNMPITEDQLKAILGNSQIQDLARQFGLPVDAVLKILAQYLPELVDKASPNGTLQSHRT